MEKEIRELYDSLYRAFGPQHWWPGDTPFEVILGAILTQNTAWANVEKALANLKHANLLTPERLHRAQTVRIAKLIRPSGYFNTKARKLKAFMQWLYAAYGGSLRRMFRQDLATLRSELLGVFGIGPETADSILLYAAEKPIFVVDAYTRRIAARLGWTKNDATYDELQRLFMQNLLRNVALFNEYHALLVALGKDYCLKTKPRCDTCPVRDVCAYPSQKSEG